MIVKTKNIIDELGDLTIITGENSELKSHIMQQIYELHQKKIFYFPAQRTSVFDSYPDTPETAKFVNLIFEKYKDLMYKYFRSDNGREYIWRHPNNIADDMKPILKFNEIVIGEYGITGLSSTNPSYIAWDNDQKQAFAIISGVDSFIGDKSIKWVVIEEPENGLHPKGVVSFFSAVISLLALDYKIILTSNSDIILTAVYAINEVKKNKGTWQDLQKLFPASDKNKLESLLNKEISTYYIDDVHQKIKDISPLDPFCGDADESDWGGITEFATKTSQVLSGLNNTKPQNEIMDFLRDPKYTTPISYDEFRERIGMELE